MKPLKRANEFAAGNAFPPGQGTEVSDADLVRAAGSGDKQAFVEIVARHQAMVCATALGVVGNVAASEDAAQEAFVIAWRKIQELREPEKLRGWLRQIARHAALGYQRRQRGHDALEESAELPDLAPAPDELTANEEEAALIRKALSQLPEQFREPMILYYRENQSSKAVAEALDLSEEAVRQRLARGRELLREQISDVIETVLTRTRPTALFTMTVAVAIGALASPAAVAGSVFSATATASSITGSSFVKTVTAWKTFLFVAGLVMVVCIPAGYFLSAPDDVVDVEAGAKFAALPVGAGTAPELSAIFAEWKRLHDTHGTNLLAMPAIYREIAGFNDPIRRRGFHAALMAEWVELGATNVMAAFRDRTIESSQRRQFIDEWIAQDGVTAIESLASGARGGDTLARSALPELARRAPERVAGIVAKLPAAENSQDTKVREAFAIVAEQGIESARTAAEMLKGANRDQALAGVAQAWGKRDLEAALAWAKQLPVGTDSDEVIRSALVGAASSAPVSALERVGTVPPGGRKGYFASTTGARVLKEAAAVDFDGTVSWLAANPGRLSSEDLMGMAGAVGEKLNADAAGFFTRYATAGSLGVMLPAITNALVKESSGQRRVVWEWLKEQPEVSTITSALRRQVLSAAGEQDAAMAFRLAEDLAQSAEGGAELGLLADGLLGHGATLHRLNRLLKEAPQPLHQPLVESAFAHLEPETLSDPQRWIALLPRLPEASRARGAASLARVWAEQGTDDAIAWATSMAGEERVESVAAIASTWATKDSPAASIWIASMPSGAERDLSAQSLVFAIAEEFPREAWDWALSIGDAERRIRAVTHTAKVMALRDATVARSWIENGPFTAETKATLQATLEITSSESRVEP